LLGSSENYISGRWCGGGELREILNPSTGQASSIAVGAGSAEVEAAVRAARRAFEAGGWSNHPRRRAAALLAMADHLSRHRKGLAEVAVAESGKRTVEINGEIDIAISELRYYAGIARTIFGRVQEVGEGELSVFSREPIGVVAVVVPWNAPIALLIRSLAPALAAGCTVVIKASPQTALTNALMIKAFAEVETLSAGIVNSLNESDGAVGRALVAHREIDAISFTGSRETAGHIMRSAADTLKRLNLELGGKSPAIIFEDAPVGVTAAAIARGATIAAGQQCTAISRVLVPRALEQRYAEELATRLRALKIAAAHDPASEMGPVISAQSRMRLLGIATAHSANAVLMGTEMQPEGQAGWYLSPSLIYSHDVHASLVQEEHFGPILTLESFDDPMEAVHKANATIYGLAASVWTKDAAVAQSVARALKSGTVWINSHNRLFPEAETGGYKQSGLGRLHGATALDSFLETKHVFQASPFLPSVSLE
jgi:betaine-aldehyde dehydrogenase